MAASSPVTDGTASRSSSRSATRSCASTTPYLVAVVAGTVSGHESGEVGMAVCPCHVMAWGVLPPRLLGACGPLMGTRATSADS